MRPVSESEVRIANAGELGVPMMKRERMMVMPNVKTMALTGTSQPGCTFAKKRENGMPLSRANDLREVSSFWRRDSGSFDVPELTRCRGHVVDEATGEE